MSRKHLMSVSVRPRPSFYRHQQGVALLTILLMVVTATILATGLLLRQERAVRETTILLRQDQALQYGLAGENLLTALLIADAQNNTTDSNKDIWAQPTPPYPIEDGVITGRLIDQSGKFNLNNLYHDGKVDTTALDYFKRLLTHVGLQVNLANAVVDWQDPDDEPMGADGAESSFYLGLNPGYLAANRPFQQVEELKKVRGFDDATYQKLAPYITALPQFSPINVNTAPPMVLAALDDSLSLPIITNWVTVRDGAAGSALAQVSSLWSDSTFAQVPQAQQTAVASLLDIKSSYFEAQIQITLGGRTRSLTSEMYRAGQTVYVWRRSLAPINQLPASAVAATS